MAKRFFFVSAGVLCLMLAAAVGFHMGSTSARASYVLTTTGIRAINGASYLLDENNQVWEFPGPDGTWTRAATYDPPVPIENIKFWNGGELITWGNVAWREGGGWHNCGPWPGGTVPTNQSTWGATKEQFKPKD